MEELGESELGTQEFWDQRYSEEIKNFKDHGDPGEIWFGEDCNERVINWIIENNIDEHSKILDVGCGNGMFLIELARHKFINLYGADYSKYAITLAKSIADKQGFMSINYFVQDFLKDLDQNFYVIHDKGTYDAVSLSENAEQHRVKYLENIHKNLDNSGYFIITSCNWTKEELDRQFQSKFTCHKIIPTPQFKFGGKVGNVVTTVVYKKV